MEHGYDQAEKVGELMKDAGFDSVTSVADLSGILRITLAREINKIPLAQTFTS